MRRSQEVLPVSSKSRIRLTCCSLAPDASPLDGEIEAAECRLTAVNQWLVITQRPPITSVAAISLLPIFSGGSTNPFAPGSGIAQEPSLVAHVPSYPT
jgi:hypothetical protein